MASTEDRIRKLVDDNLEIEGRAIGRSMNLDVSLIDAGVSSADAVAFWKVVNEEFGVSISAEEFAGLLTPRALIAYLDANAG